MCDLHRSHFAKFMSNIVNGKSYNLRYANEWHLITQACETNYVISSRNLWSNVLNWLIAISCKGARDLIWKDYWWLITFNRSKVLIHSYRLRACVEVIECRICFNSVFLHVRYIFNVCSVCLKSGDHLTEWGKLKWTRKENKLTKRCLPKTQICLPCSQTPLATRIAAFHHGRQCIKFSRKKIQG